jgi:hypothetical protein
MMNDLFLSTATSTNREVLISVAAPLAVWKFELEKDFKMPGNFRHYRDCASERACLGEEEV